MGKAYRLSELEQLVLFVIRDLNSIGYEAYGVSIKEELSHKMDTSLAFGTIYKILDRLKRRGYIQSSWSDPGNNRGGRAKRLYTLQAKGIDAISMLERRYSSLLGVEFA